MKTGTQQAASDSNDTQKGVASFKWFLLAFGGIALIVGGSVIANTLSITVAQRIRELATLRTLGASRRQVLRRSSSSRSSSGSWARSWGFSSG